jgi:predicted permease
MNGDDDHVPAWRRYLRITRTNAARDVDDELTFHIQSTIEELVTHGMSYAAAAKVAGEQFGDVGRIRDTLFTLSAQRERTMERIEFWQTLKQDVVFGVRQLRKSLGFTLIALFVLALGIGANSAIFSVVYAVVLTPLPYANGDRLVRLYDQFGDRHGEVSFGNYLSWRQQGTTFDVLGATWGSIPMTLTGVGEPAPIASIRATASYWKAAYIKPTLGRYFDESEDREGAGPVVVLSTALWQHRFASDSAIVGRTVMLEGRGYTVVGVAAPDYVLSEPAEQVWVPLVIGASQASDHGDHELQVFGVVRRGVPIARAAREVSRISTSLAKEYPHSRFDDAFVQPLADSVVGPQRATLFTLLGAVGLVLLIACANVANLLIARASARRGEMAIRGALGASRGRIVMQLLIESLLIALAGGALGLLVALAGIRFLITSPAAIPRLQNTTLNTSVVAFTMLLSVGCAILFGLFPALRASRLDLQQTLRDGGRDSAASARDRLRGVLVVGELCLAQILLIGAGLLIRSQILVQSVPVGFDTHNLLATSISLPPSRYGTAAQRDAAFQQIERAIGAIPGVRAVGRSQVVPVYSHGWNWTAMREGSDGHDAGAVTADMRGVSPGYFDALGIPVRLGRAFAEADGPDASPVAIVSRGLAKQLFGAANPIGRRISNGSVQQPRWREIVGVVDDMHANGPYDDPPMTMYMPSASFVNGGQTIVVRGAVPVLTLIPQIRRAVASVDPLLALSGISTIDESLSRLLAIPRFATMLLALLGLTGLVLAVVGVYGVIAYFVAQRTHELGVRLALGASGNAVQWLVVKQGLMLAAIGVIMGVGLALGTTRLLRSMMFGITSHDPMTFVVVAAVLAVVAVLASYIPARRATRIDPLEALRSS